MTGPTTLLTLPDVYAHLQIPATQQTDVATQLQGFIDAATSVIQDITGPIVQQTYSEVKDGGGTTIAVCHVPIVTVTSLVEYIGATGYTLVEAELGAPCGQYSYSLDEPSHGIITRRYSGGFAGQFAAGESNIAITYTAGQSAVDPEIRMATLLDIQGLWTQSQYAGTSSAFGSGFDNTADSEWSATLPMNLFPRLMSVLQAPKRRLPAIA